MKTTPPPPPPLRRSWAVLRRIFRWCRILVLFVLFLLVFAAIYFNAIGLPDFIKRPLLGQLQAQGWEVEFTEMRWHWYRGVVIENARFRRTNDTVRFFAQATDLKIDLAAVRQSQFKLKSLVMTNADLAYTLSSNRPPLRLQQMKTKVRLLSGDQLQLDTFEASLAGVKIQVSGTLTNAADLLQRKPAAKPGTMQTALPLGTTQPSARQTLPQKLEEILAWLDQIHFTETPELQITAQGDIRDWKTFQGTLRGTVPQAETPWGKFQGVNLRADWQSELPVNVHLTATAVETRWGKSQGGTAQVLIRPDASQPEGAQSELHISLNQWEAAWPDPAQSASVVAGRAQFDGRMKHSLPHFIPEQAEGTLRLSRSAFHFSLATNRLAAQMPQGEVRFTFDRRAANAAKLSAADGPWQKLEPLTLHWNVDLREVKAPPLELAKLRCRGDWQAPELSLTQWEAELYGGTFSTSGNLNVPSRKAQVVVSSDVDWQQLAPLLPDVAQKWLAQCHGSKTPKVEGEIIGTLPDAWLGIFKPDAEPGRHTRPQAWLAAPRAQQLQPTAAEAWAEVRSTWQINAALLLEDFTFFQIPTRSVQAQVNYSNQVWTLSDVHLVLPEGDVRLHLESDDRTGTFHSHWQSQLDPKALRPLLTKQLQPWFAAAQFTTPPKIIGEIWGEWQKPSSFGLKASIALTNFSFRELHLDQLTARLDYTNLFLHCTDLQARQGERHLTSPKIAIDLHTNRVFFTDVHSTLEPFAVTRCLGQHIYEAVAPYQFAEPPTVLLNGAVNLDRTEGADLHFDVAGGKFRWGLLHTDTAAGRVDWVDHTLVITNARASAYQGGELAGAAFILFLPEGGAAYRLQAVFTNVNALALTATLPKTNGVEGWVDGRLQVTAADTTGLQTWQGDGVLHLRDGLIWDIPVFGIFSPMLEAISPGLGKNRAKQASARFTITNGVAHSDDLEIRAGTLRMQYRGTFDYAGRVNARVEAELFRDAFLIGRFISAALSPLSKVFEYKMSGTLEQPVMEPVYIPKFLMMTLRPFHTLRSLLPEKAK